MTSADNADGAPPASGEGTPGQGEAAGAPAETEAAAPAAQAQADGTCGFCQAAGVPLVAVLDADPDQMVCADCHFDSRLATTAIAAGDSAAPATAMAEMISGLKAAGRLAIIHIGAAGPGTGSTRPAAGQPGEREQEAPQPPAATPADTAAAADDTRSADLAAQAEAACAAGRYREALSLLADSELLNIDPAMDAWYARTRERFEAGLAAAGTGGTAGEDAERQHDPGTGPARETDGQAVPPAQAPRPEDTDDGQAPDATAAAAGDGPSGEQAELSDVWRAAYDAGAMAAAQGRVLYVYRDPAEGDAGRCVITPARPACPGYLSVTPAGEWTETWRGQDIQVGGGRQRILPDYPVTEDEARALARAAHLEAHVTTAGGRTWILLAEHGAENAPAACFEAGTREAWAGRGAVTPGQAAGWLETYRARRDELDLNPFTARADQVWTCRVAQLFPHVIYGHDHDRGAKDGLVAAAGLKHRGNDGAAEWWMAEAEAAAPPLALSPAREAALAGMITATAAASLRETGDAGQHTAARLEATPREQAWIAGYLAGHPEALEGNTAGQDNPASTDEDRATVPEAGLPAAGAPAAAPANSAAREEKPALPESEPPGPAREDGSPDAQAAATAEDDGPGPPAAREAAAQPSPAPAETPAAPAAAAPAGQGTAGQAASGDSTAAAGTQTRAKGRRRANAGAANQLMTVLAAELQAALDSGDPAQVTEACRHAARAWSQPGGQWPASAETRPWQAALDGLVWAGEGERVMLRDLAGDPTPHAPGAAGAQAPDPGTAQEPEPGTTASAPAEAAPGSAGAALPAPETPAGQPSGPAGALAEPEATAMPQPGEQAAAGNATPAVTPPEPALAPEASGSGQPGRDTAAAPGRSALDDRGAPGPAAPPPGTEPLAEPQAWGGKVRPGRLLHPDETALMVRGQGEDPAQARPATAAGTVPVPAGSRYGSGRLQVAAWADGSGYAVVHPAMAWPAGTDPYDGLDARQRARWAALDAAEAGTRPAADLPPELVDIGDTLRTSFTGADGKRIRARVTAITPRDGGFTFTAEGTPGTTCAHGQTVEVYYTWPHPVLDRAAAATAAAGPVAPETTGSTVPEAAGPGSAPAAAKPGSGEPPPQSSGPVAGPGPGAPSSAGLATGLHAVAGSSTDGALAIARLIGYGTRPEPGAVPAPAGGREPAAWDAEALFLPGLAAGIPWGHAAAWAAAGMTPGRLAILTSAGRLLRHHENVRGEADAAGRAAEADAAAAEAAVVLREQLDAIIDGAARQHGAAAPVPPAGGDGGYPQADNARTAGEDTVIARLDRLRAQVDAARTRAGTADPLTPAQAREGIRVAIGPRLPEYLLAMSAPGALRALARREGRDRSPAAGWHEGEQRYTAAARAEGLVIRRHGRGGTRQVIPWDELPAWTADALPGPELAAITDLAARVRDAGSLTAGPAEPGLDQRLTAASARAWQAIMAAPPPAGPALAASRASADPARDALPGMTAQPASPAQEHTGQDGNEEAPPPGQDGPGAADGTRADELAATPAGDLPSDATPPATATEAGPGPTADAAGTAGVPPAASQAKADSAAMASRQRAALAAAAQGGDWSQAMAAQQAAVEWAEAGLECPSGWARELEAALNRTAPPDTWVTLDEAAGVLLEPLAGSPPAPILPQEAPGTAPGAGASPAAAGEPGAEPQPAPPDRQDDTWLRSPALADAARQPAPRLPELLDAVDAGQQAAEALTAASRLGLSPRRLHASGGFQVVLLGDPAGPGPCGLIYIDQDRGSLAQARLSAGPGQPPQTLDRAAAILAAVSALSSPATAGQPATAPAPDAVRASAGDEPQPPQHEGDSAVTNETSQQPASLAAAAASPPAAPQPLPGPPPPAAELPRRQAGTAWAARPPAAAPPRRPAELARPSGTPAAEAPAQTTPTARTPAPPRTWTWAGLEENAGETVLTVRTRHGDAVLAGQAGQLRYIESLVNGDAVPSAPPARYDPQEQALLIPLPGEATARINGSGPDGERVLQAIAAALNGAPGSAQAAARATGIQLPAGQVPGAQGTEAPAPAAPAAPAGPGKAGEDQPAAASAGDAAPAAPPHPDPVVAALLERMAALEQEVAAWRASARPTQGQPGGDSWAQPADNASMLNRVMRAAGRRMGAPQAGTAQWQAADRLARQADHAISRVRRGEAAFDDEPRARRRWDRIWEGICDAVAATADWLMCHVSAGGPTWNTLADVHHEARQHAAVFGGRRGPGRPAPMGTYLPTRATAAAAAQLAAIAGLCLQDPAPAPDPGPAPAPPPPAASPAPPAEEPAAEEPPAALPWEAAFVPAARPPWDPAPHPAEAAAPLSGPAHGADHGRPRAARRSVLAGHGRHANPGRRTSQRR